MVNMGIDFGSTYTIISVYQQATDTPEAQIASNGSPYIPTLVAYKEEEEKYEFGFAAKAITGMRSTTLFKGFKMLLMEGNAAALSSRGYTAPFTPQWLTKYFLESSLRKVLSDLHQRQIDHLVVGVPEIWNEQMAEVDARVILRGILKEFDFVRDVQVVSEPAAATAFFTYNFKRITGSEYDGSILLVDYGGGTLDLTLTDVRSVNGSVEIKVLERTGAGENEDGKIGKAGIVYMETVMAEAIRQCGEFGDRLPKLDGRFFKAVDELEEHIQFRTGDIKAVFDTYGVDCLDDLEPKKQRFTYIDYRGEYVPVTYQLLVDVYDRVIRPVLAEKLAYMKDYMDRNGIDYRNREQERFKIALVGGFGNFYLVKKQIEDTFKFSVKDMRLKNIIQKTDDKEKSISLGAALLAANVVSIRNSSPLSVGFFSQDANGGQHVNYAITHKQDIEYGKPYFSEDEATGTPVRYLLTHGSLSQLVLNAGSGENTARLISLEPLLRQRLSRLTGQLGLVALGVSLDASGLLTLHIREYGLDRSEPDPHEIKIELAKACQLLQTAKSGTPGGSGEV